MGEYPRSLECYTKSLRISESMNDDEGIASTNHNLGVLFDMMQEPEKGLEYFERALTWYQENHYGKDAAAVQSNIANIYTKDRKSTRLNSSTNAQLVCRLLLEKTNTHKHVLRHTLNVLHNTKI